MPTRTTPFVTDHFYHIFNRGANKQPIFLGVRDYKRFLGILEFYIFNPKLRFSKFLLLSKDERESFLERLRKENEKLVEIICFCLMPNHFHLLVTQKKDNGISKFMATLQNSYTRYLNTKYARTGSFLQGQFKAVHLEDDNQLLHLSRYIHLNPYSSVVVKELPGLEKYQWSSLPEYSGKTSRVICNKEPILSHFGIEVYKQFVFDQAEYQRKLEIIKHLTLE